MFTNPKIDGETAEKDWDFSSEEVEGEALFPLVDNKSLYVNISLTQLT